MLHLKRFVIGFAVIALAASLCGLFILPIVYYTKIVLPVYVILAVAVASYRIGKAILRWDVEDI